MPLAKAVRKPWNRSATDVRILLVTDWMRHPGGAERYVSDLRRGLEAAGDEVRLLTSSAGTAADGTADYVAWGSRSAWLQAGAQIANLPAVAKCRSAVRDFDPQVVLVNMFANHLSPAVFSAWRHLPAFVLATDFKLVCPAFAKTLPGGETCCEREGAACLRHRCVSLPHWLRDRPRYAWLRRTVQRSAGVFACSRFVHGELARNGISSEILPLPVDPPSTAFRRRPAADPLFVFSGRLATQKGIFLLARAFARLRRDMPTARLRYIGDGPERGRLEHLVGELEIAPAVELTGWVDPDRVEERLEEAWATVAPTLGPEPLGMVALESIVRGIPVVATGNGGFAETVEDGISGLLVADGDEDDLLRGLRRIATGASFAEHRIDPATSRTVLTERSLGTHVASLRRRLATA